MSRRSILTRASILKLVVKNNFFHNVEDSKNFILKRTPTSTIDLSRKKSLMVSQYSSVGKHRGDSTIEAMQNVRNARNCQNNEKMVERLFPALHTRTTYYGTTLTTRAAHLHTKNYRVHTLSYK